MRGSVTMKPTARNGKIDLLKFLFSLAVIVFHFGKGIYRYDFCNKGYIAVEFFFVVSGFLFARSLSRYSCYTDTLAKDSTAFMKRKFLSLFPYHLFCFLVCFVFTAVWQSWGAGTWPVHLFNALPDLLMLQMSGLSHLSLLRYEWYLSAMLIVMFIFTPIAIKYRKFFLYWLCPVVFVFAVGWLYHQKHDLDFIRQWTGVCMAGILRAAAELSLGCLCYIVHENKWLDRVPKALLFLIEGGIYAVTFLYMSRQLDGLNDFTILFLMGIVVPISFSDRTSLRFLNNRFVYFLGKWSYSIYLMQLLVIEIVKPIDCGSSVLHTLLFVGCTLVAAWVCMIVTDSVLKLLRHWRDQHTSKGTPSSTGE